MATTTTTFLLTIVNTRTHTAVERATEFEGEILRGNALEAARRAFWRHLGAPNVSVTLTTNKSTGPLYLGHCDLREEYVDGRWVRAQPPTA